MVDDTIIRPALATAARSMPRRQVSPAMSDIVAQHAVGDIRYISNWRYADLYFASRFKALYGGRGSGKSYAAADAAIARACYIKEYRTVCGRQFQNSIAESMKLLIEERIKYFGLESFFKITDYYIEHIKKGSHFIFIGIDRNPTSMKSLEGADLFIGEESQTFSQDSLDILIPTIRKVGSELWFLWNPVNPDDPVDNMFRGPGFVPDHDIIVHNVNYWHNVHFWRTPLYDEMKRLRARDPLRCKHVYDGDYARLVDAQVFKNWRVGVIDVPDTAVPLIGADWGYSNDPLAVAKSYLLNNGDTLYIEHEAGGIGVGIEDHPAIFDKIPGSRTFEITADNARPELIDFMNQKGFRVAPAAKGANSVKDGVAWLQSREIVVHPRCVNTAKELRYFSWKVDRTGTVLPILVDDWNHYIDAIRYSTEPERRPKVRLQRFTL